MTEPVKCPEFHCKLIANHAGPHICSALGCAVNHSPATSYDEYLISQAGGDGEAQRVVLTVVIGTKNLHLETVDFTNVPMERVHAAIALLNGDMQDATGFGHIGRYQDGVWIPLEFPEPPEPGHIRTEDFTLTELFPNTESGDYFQGCQECGANILSNNRWQTRHVTWHNKTLP